MSSGDFNKAIKLMHSNKFEAAIKLLLHLADSGDALAQERLGFLYMFGISVEKDYLKAKHWLKLAATTENSRAQFYLGKIYYYEKNYDSAVAFLSKSAVNKFPPSFYLLSIIFRSEDSVYFDLENSLKCIRLGSDLNHITCKSQYLLHKIKNTNNYIHKAKFSIKRIFLYLNSLILVFHEYGNPYISKYNEDSLLNIVDNELLLI